MKFLTVEQIRDLDAFTIAHEPITSLDLMERAATASSQWILEMFANCNKAVVICGSGNNGGDGLVIARNLAEEHWSLTVIYPDFTPQSADFASNLERLRHFAAIEMRSLSKHEDLPDFPGDCLIIDAIFGSGLSRPLEGTFASWVRQINNSDQLVISIDIPSGLFADKPTHGLAVKSDFTLSFEVPKKAFVIPENGEHIGEWIILPIGLHPDKLDETITDWFLTQEDDAASLLRSRKKFDHKGIYGHALIVAGSTGKGGAAVLASMAAMRTGAGLVTAHIPGSLASILQSAAPEVMVDIDKNDLHLTGIEGLDQFTSIGIGPGLGTHDDSYRALTEILNTVNRPVVLDADAINLIAASPGLLGAVPQHSILTPHIREFERLFGKCNDHYERLARLHTVAMTHSLVIVLKGAYTAIATPDGKIYFNTTGNPGMATAGSGDILTGMITALLAQGYPPLDAARLGVYLHGLAGDFSADVYGEESMIASDIIAHIGASYRTLRME